MRRELIVKSKSLSGTSDLTLLASITPGLVPSLDTVTHKSRIKRLLQTLNAGRGSSQEYALLRPFSDAVERVGKIHSVRVAVLEPENKVMLAVTFDGSWEAYIRVLWQKVGTLLDIIFFDTEGYVSAYDNRFEQWEAWCRRVQVETHFFYGMPSLTVDDVRYLRHEEKCHRQMPGQPGADLAAARYAVQSPEQLSWQVAAKTSAQTSLETMKQGFESLAALYRLADLYLPSTEDGLFLQRAARDLLMEFVVLLGADEFPASLLAGARERFDKQLVWLLKAVPPPKNTQRALPPMPVAMPEFDRADVQGGIVRTYDGVTHGCLLLLAIEDRDRAVAFFRRLVAEVTVDSADQFSVNVAVNVAFTYEGLRATGLSEAELAMFPEEFREGMEARASFLGDVRGNHPRRWKLPRRFDEDDAGAEGRVELAAVHVVLQLRVRGRRGVETLDASDARYLAEPPFAEWLAATRSGGMRLLAVEQMQRRFCDDGAVMEHFGFADGDSDPGIDPSLAGTTYPNQIRLGEVLVGYGNEADWPPDPEKAVDPARERARLDWLRNGSFLVVRKLAQDVAALDDALAAAAHRLEPEFPGLTAEALAEKMMGRTRRGDPLVDGASGAGRNDFDYSGDAEGRRCPFHAHIRRANPRLHRQALNEAEGRRTPRIVRRGMSYGPAVAAVADAEAADRGLVFMAYNASIGEQFEIVQRWIAGGNGSGGYSGQSDPFLGVAENGARRTFRFELQAAEGDDAAQARVVSITLDGNDEALGERRPFVRLEWGTYLFAPSMTALRRLTDRLAAVRPAPEPAWSAAEGAALIAHLQAGELAAPEVAADAWKAALEDPVEVEKFRSASIWAAIREQHGGVLHTPYGVLVADRALAMKVLGDGVTYSVSGYAKRLDRSIGAIYLGKDDGDEYQRQCRPVNDAIQAIPRAQAFADTRAIAGAVIAGVLQRASLDAPNPVEPSQWELILEIKELIDPVLGKLCQGWFGLPTTDDADIRLEGSRWDAEARRALYPGHFTAPSRYVFQPRPGPAAERYGCDYGRTITAAFTRFLQSNIDKGTPWPIRQAGGTAPLGDAIWTAFGGPGADLALVARTLVGAMMGFLPTVDGNLRRALNEWLYEGTFWSLRERWQALAAPTLADAEAVLAPPLRRAMQLRPSPELVWRTSTHPHALAGVWVGEGDIVVVSIASAAQQCLAAGDPGDSILFGGDRSQPGHPTHACPGYEAAMGVLLGFIAALLDVKVSMRPSAVPLALTFDGELGDFAGAAADALMKARAEAETDAADEAARDNSAALADLETALAARAPPPVLLPARRPPQPGADLVIGLGDSWFHYFALDVFDVLREKHGYDALSLAQEGAGLLSIRKDPAQLLRLARALDDAVLANRPPKAVLLSAGGNDVVTPQLGKLLGKRSARALLNEKAVASFVDGRMKRALAKIIEKIDGLCRHRLGGSVPIVMHGYGYPNPDGRGPLGTGFGAWLRPDFAAVGYDRSAGDDARAFATMTELIDRLNAMQLSVAAQAGCRVEHVDLRPVLKTEPYTLDWGNELHPTAEGFVRVADAIAAKLKAVMAGSAA